MFSHFGGPFPGKFCFVHVCSGPELFPVGRIAHVREPIHAGNALYISGEAIDVGVGPSPGPLLSRTCLRVVFGSVRSRGISRIDPKGANHDTNAIATQALHLGLVSFYPPDEAALDYGHDDPLTADNAKDVVWSPILQ